MPRRRPFPTPLDLGLLMLLALGGTYLAHRLITGVDYRWEWEVIPQYLVRQDPASGAWLPNHLLKGLLTTLRLSLWATILATLLGTALGLCRVVGSLFKRLVARCYVESVRNLPPLVLVFIFYYFLSEQILPHLGLDTTLRGLAPAAQDWVAVFLAQPGGINAFLAGVLTLAIYEGAYISEIVRAGVESVERGQWEASHALGLSLGQTLAGVILPQALRRILPPLSGQFISCIKDSAIVSVISIPELTFQGMELMSATYLTFEVWITVAAMYLILSLALSLAVAHLETRLARRGG